MKLINLILFLPDARGHQRMRVSSRDFKRGGLG